MIKVTLTVTDGTTSDAIELEAMDLVTIENAVDDYFAAACMPESEVDPNEVYTVRKKIEKLVQDTGLRTILFQEES